jgi:hypothetical protein
MDTEGKAVPMSKRFFVILVAALAALSVGGCSIKEDSGDDKKDSGQVTTPTQPSTTPQSTTPTTPATTPTEPTDTTPTTPSTGGRTDTTDINGIIVSIRRYFDGGRKGNATTWCGEQSDALLSKNFGGLDECIASDVANKADGDIPPGRNLDFDDSITLDGDKANATPSTISGSTTYDIDLVYEGADSGWAIDKIDNDG